MSEQIDRAIAELEKQLADLRRRKLSELQSQVAALQASLDGEERSAPRRGRPPGKAAPVPAKRGPAGKTSKGCASAVAADPSAFAASPRKGRGRKRGKRIGDADAIAMLSKTVSAAGSDGVSARQAAQSSGVFYPRAIGLMGKHFKKSGSGKWTRYTLK